MTVTPVPADPGNIEYCTLRYRAIMAVADDLDPDYDPDWRPIPGIKVTATPSIARAVIADTPFGPVTVVPKAIVGITDADGIMRLIKADGEPDTTFQGMRVVAGDNSGMAPSLFTYDVRFQGEDIDYTKTVTAPAGEVVDLSLATPVPADPGVDLEAWVAAVATVELARDEIVDTAGNIGLVYQMVAAAAAAAVTAVAAPVNWNGAVSLTNGQLINTVIHATLTGNVALALPAGTAGQSYACQLMLTQDATAAIRTVTVTAPLIRKQWNYDPPLSTKAGATDMVTLFWDGYFWNVGVGLVSLGVS